MMLFCTINSHHQIKRNVRSYWSDGATEVNMIKFYTFLVYTIYIGWVNLISFSNQYPTWFSILPPP